MQHWKWTAIPYIFFSSLISSDYTPLSRHISITWRSISLGYLGAAGHYGVSMQAEHGNQEGQSVQFHFKSALITQLRIHAQCFPKACSDFTFIPWVLSSLPTTLYSCQQNVQTYVGSPQLKVGQLTFHWAVQIMTKVYLLFKSNSFCIFFFLYSLPKLLLQSFTVMRDGQLPILLPEGHPCFLKLNVRKGNSMLD